MPRLLGMLRAARIALANPNRPGVLDAIANELDTIFDRHAPDRERNAAEQTGRKRKLAEALHASEYDTREGARWADIQVHDAARASRLDAPCVPCASKPWPASTTYSNTMTTNMTPTTNTRCACFIAMPLTSGPCPIATGLKTSSSKGFTCPEEPDDPSHFICSVRIVLLCNTPNPLPSPITWWVIETRRVLVTAASSSSNQSK